MKVTKAKSRFLAFALIVAMVFTLTPFGTKTAEAVTYPSYNQGHRDTVATALSADAIAYYTKECGAYATYQEAFGGKTGSALKNELETLMTETMTDAVMMPRMMRSPSRIFLRGVSGFFCFFVVFVGACKIRCPFRYMKTKRDCRMPAVPHLYRMYYRAIYFFRFSRPQEMPRRLSSQPSNSRETNPS